MNRNRAGLIALLLVLLPVSAYALSELRTTSQNTAQVPTADDRASFTSPKLPVPISDESIIAIGDSGSGDTNQSELAAAIATTVKGHRVAALVMTGDNVYPDGSPERFGLLLDAPYRSWLDSSPIVATLGNHDVQAGYGASQLEHLDLPALPFRRVVGDLEFFVLDANHPDNDQAAWLDLALTNSAAKYTVVVFHQPAYSCSKHGSTPEVQNYFVPVIDAHSATLVLNGHDHNYQRFTSDRGVTYVVTGGGGAALYPILDCDTPVKRLKATSVHHFLVLTATPTGLDLSAIALDGELVDHALLPPTKKTGSN